jgi:hypothetical protein
MAVFRFAAIILASTCSLPLSNQDSHSSPFLREHLQDQDAPEADPAVADESDQLAAIRLVNPVRNRWRVGAQLKGGSKAATNLLVTIPVPNEWPEQKVSVYEENIPSEVQSVKYRELNSNVRQLVATIPRLNANQLIELTVTFDVETSEIEGPTDPSGLQLPERLPREIKQYTGVSPQISYRNSKLRNQVKEIIAGEELAWKKVEAIFEWVTANIKYSGDEPTDTVEVFRQRSGSSEDLVGLFVAMCRAAKVPARMVWVEGAQYAEFYLVDKAGTGHWFPCQVAGRREFGSNAEPRIILQKGDNIKVPEKKLRQKFCAEFITGSGKAKPRYRFIRELLPAN